VRGFKKAMSEGEDEQAKQLTEQKPATKDADFQESNPAKSDSKPG